MDEPAPWGAFVRACLPGGLSAWAAQGSNLRPADKSPSQNADATGNDAKWLAWIVRGVRRNATRCAAEPAPNRHRLRGMRQPQITGSRAPTPGEPDGNGSRPRAARPRGAFPL